jgi:hypothetical protein
LIKKETSVRPHQHAHRSTAATAQAIYGTVGVGAATALMTLASGWLYSWLGGLAFLATGVLCLAALPIRLRADQRFGTGC